MVTDKLRVPQLPAKNEACTAFQSLHPPLLPQPLKATGEEAGAGVGVWSLITSAYVPLDMPNVRERHRGYPSSLACGESGPRCLARKIPGS